MNEPLTKEGIWIVEELNGAEYVSMKDVRQAVQFLRERVYQVQDCMQNPGLISERNVQKLIDECFPVFAEKKELEK